MGSKVQKTIFSRFDFFSIVSKYIFLVVIPLTYVLRFSLFLSKFSFWEVKCLIFCFLHQHFWYMTVNMPMLLMYQMKLFFHLLFLLVWEDQRWIVEFKSLHICIQLYMRLSQQQFMEGPTILVMNHIWYSIFCEHPVSLNATLWSKAPKKSELHAEALCSWIASLTSIWLLQPEHYSQSSWT